MSNKRCAYPKNGGPGKYKNHFKKSAKVYFTKLGITRYVLNEDVNLVAISEKTKHVDCNTKTENPLERT